MRRRTVLAVALWVVAAPPALAAEPSARERAVAERSAAMVRLLGGKDVAGAREGLARAVALDPSYAEAHFDLGMLACAAEDWAAAKSAFEAASRGGGSVAERARARLARVDAVLRRASDPAAARARRYEEAVFRARSFLAARKLREAYAEAGAAAKLDPERWEAYAVAGSALRSAGSLAEASAFLRRAADRAPEAKAATLRAHAGHLDAEVRRSAVTQRAAAAATAGRHGEAGDLYLEAWKVDASKEQLGVRAAAAYLLAGRLDSAEALLRPLLASKDPAVAREARTLATRRQVLAQQPYVLDEARAAAGRADSGTLLFYADRIPGHLARAVLARLREGKPVLSVAIGPDDCWAVAFGKDGATWSVNCPEAMRTELGKLVKEGREVRGVALGGEGRWAVLYGDHGGTWVGLPENVSNWWKASSGTIGCVAMGPDESTSFVGASGYSMYASDARNAAAREIHATTVEAKADWPFTAAAFGPDDQYAFVFGSNGFRCSGPSGMNQAMGWIHEAKLGLQTVAISPRGGWLVVGKR